jgi:ketosteroid isomerase-like protein
MTAIPKGAPSSFTMWYRVTLGLRRIDEQWLIVHEHTSVPFYMDGSFRAAVDLAP